MVKETTEDATIDFIPFEWTTYLVLHSIRRKSTRFTNFNNKHIQTPFSQNTGVFDLYMSMEERTTPVLEASVTNQCAAHTRSINGL